MTTHHASVEEHVNARVEATARVIANFAWQHMKAAATFRDHVSVIESANTAQPFGSFFEDIRSYGSGCIMSAAASLEALINEFFITPEGPLRKKMADFETEFWGRAGIERKPPLEKYQIALEMLEQPRLDEHALPFRDAWALFELRNALVHYKPTWDPDRQRKVEMVEVLLGKYDLSPFPDDGSDFVTMRSMSASCMRWVVSTAVSFLREFHARAKLDEHKLSTFWRSTPNPAAHADARASVVPCDGQWARAGGCERWADTCRLVVRSASQAPRVVRPDRPKFGSPTPRGVSPLDFPWKRL